MFRKNDYNKQINQISPSAGRFVMTLRINSNDSMGIYRQLRESGRALNNSLERFSSGKRINRAADDASGMLIADSLGSQLRGIGQSIRNATDTIAMAQVADGALGESVSLLQNIRAKTLQAAGGGQDSASLQALQADINKSLASLNDIATNTSYNGQKLLSGTFTDKSFQIGAYSGETVDLNIGSASPAEPYNTLNTINVLSPEGAQEALTVIDNALAEIDQLRGDIGSTRNQLESTVANLSITEINIAASKSGISDLDFAEESTNSAQMKVLDQARMFALAQSGKMNKEGILNLLQG